MAKHDKIEQELYRLDNWSKEDRDKLKRLLWSVGYDEEEQIKEKARVVPLMANVTIAELEQRMRQDDEVVGVKTGYWTLDRMTAGLARGELAIIAAPTGVGKCQRKGTLVMMANGKTRKIEDVAVGELVQSALGENLVLGKHGGYGKCFRITPELGDPMFVSDEHLVTVFADGRLKEFRVEELLTSSDEKVSSLYLWRPEIRSYRRKQLTNVYELGLALVRAWPRMDNTRLLDYLTGDWQQRCELFAGVLDSKAGFLSQTENAWFLQDDNEALLLWIAQLARGLGWGAEVQDCVLKLLPGIFDIPTKRVSLAECEKHDWRFVRFHVEQTADAEYVGIQVSGDGRFMLADNTLTHNTNLCVNMMARQLVLGYKCLFITLENSKESVRYRLRKIMGHDYFSLAVNNDNMLVQAELRLPYTAVKYAVQSAQEQGVDIVYIDHLHFFQRGMANPAEELGQITQEFKTIALEKQLPVVLVSQLRKVENGKRPGMEDLRGSALISQDADLILVLDENLDEFYSNVRVRLEKNRDRCLWRPYSEVTLRQIGFDLEEPDYTEAFDMSQDVTGRPRGKGEQPISFLE